MTDVTRLLAAADQGDPRAVEELLPLVYAELRRLAAAQMARENPGQTLSPTALVHEAYVRLVLPAKPQAEFVNRKHFFAAAAEAMRRILVEQARRKRRVRHGGALRRVDLPADLPAVVDPSTDLLAVSDALDQLAAADPPAAQLVKLVYFAGLTVAQAATALGISERTAYRNWAFARAWLYRRLNPDGQ